MPKTGNIVMAATNMIEHSKPFGVYHWDTFDNETLLIGEADTLDEAVDFVEDRYKHRISDSGADQVDIVDLSGNIVKKFKVS